MLDVHNSELLIFLHLTEWYRVSNTVSESLEFLSLNFGIFQEVCKSASNLTKRDLIMLTLWEGHALISVQNHRTECCSGLESLIIKALVCTLQIHIQLDLLCFAKNCQAI